MRSERQLQAVECFATFPSTNHVVQLIGFVDLLVVVNRFEKYYRTYSNSRIIELHA